MLLLDLDDNFRTYLAAKCAPNTLIKVVYDWVELTFLVGLIGHAHGTAGTLSNAKAAALAAFGIYFYISHAIPITSTPSMSFKFNIYVYNPN